jgi:NAD(P)-dependent dehydrogenase (short-subunit alcohol dehydrogenase family)
VAAFDFGPEDLSDLTGLTVIVTGANSGIGFETTLQLAAHNAHVVMACRDTKKAQVASERIQGLDVQASLEVLELDLSDQYSVQRAAAEYARRHDRLDVLVNNAGIMGAPYRQTADGFELQMATNHFGHFAFTGLLLDQLMTTPNSRVVTVSSQFHRSGSIDLDDVAGLKVQNPWLFYGASKLANLLFTYELGRRLSAAGSSTRALAVHPGWTRSNLALTGPTIGASRLKAKTGRVAARVGGQSAGTGALPTLYAATASEVSSGDYFGPSGFLELYGPPKKVQSNKRSHNRDLATGLWERSEALTDVTFSFADTTLVTD